LGPWPHNDSHIGAFGGRSHDRKVVVFPDETDDRPPTTLIECPNLGTFQFS
jgi:hypothetical protein